MAAYLETLISDLRAGILAAAPDLAAHGVYEAEHVDTVAWGELPLPYGVLLLEPAAEDWAADSLTFAVAVDVYLVYAQLGGGEGLRAKLEAVRDAFWPAEALTEGTTLDVEALSWGRDLPPNEKLASDPTRRAGRVRLRCLVGERP